ncbi:MAG: TonB family protein [Gammaproteobacteria bacterium]|nr:TonB family protein [Gammaproteobacteria bacterium]MBU0770746.1 TonB family protein [Gammaproteobacteria bacterium]MBU0857620.1 TonB family protein [Gammaproteobacteria bacterium]MBU1848636.1 TonB family protein [Gammaproteobacteria bacterium]
MSRLKLHFALALSVALHAALLAWPRDAGVAPTPAPARLQARLTRVAPPEKPTEAPPESAPAVLKDTRPEPEPAADPPAKPAPVAAARPSPAVIERSRVKAQQTLNSHVFYPQEAVERELEGEVRLRLLLDRSGRVLEAAVMRSSGHPLLDRAALDAARQIGRLDAGGVRELLLPVVFRLE